VGFVSRQKGIASVEATMHRDIVRGAPAPGAPAAMVPWALDRLVGTRFRVVRGYVGDTDLFIAVQRGEIDGMGSVSLNALNQRGWISQKQVDVLYAISNKRLSVLPNVPAVVELARNEHDRSVLRLLTLMSDVGITVITPPRVPEARVAALQQALAKTIEDPDFIEGERSIGIDIDPLSATDIGEIIRRVTDEPTDVIEALKSAIAPLN
jgi:tripartite-type tricarboxylate transporter receptor subunit TctC